MLSDTSTLHIYYPGEVNYETIFFLFTCYMLLFAYIYYSIKKIDLFVSKVFYLLILTFVLLNLNNVILQLLDRNKFWSCFHSCIYSFNDYGTMFYIWTRFHNKHSKSNSNVNNII